MFFPRLRRRAKWVFLLLAIAFALSVVFFGVGTGISGANPWDAIQSFLTERGGSPSVDAAAEEAADNPRDADAHIAYASALQAEGRTREAIAVLEAFTARVPRSAAALRQLAALWGNQAAEAQQAAERAQLEAQELSIPQAFAPESPFVRDLRTNQIAQVLSAQASERAQAAQARAADAARRQAAVYQQLTRLEPGEPIVFLQLATASQQAGDFEAAIAAYERFLELAPEDPNAPLVREQIDALKQATSG